MTTKRNQGFIARTSNRILTGVLAVVPLLITWLVLRFLFDLLAWVGQPGVKALAAALRPVAPGVAAWLTGSGVTSAVAIVLLVVGLYFLGFAASQVLGRRILGLFEAVLARIPLVKTIYGAVKQFVEVLRSQPRGLDRVVLIEFPTPEMKTIGLATRMLRDSDTGEELVAVYVPTTPNPTSGYLEIVPRSRVISTDWTLDEATTFIVSGGAVGRREINYRKDRSADWDAGAEAGAPDDRAGGDPGTR